MIEVKKHRKNSKNKGNSFERQIAKQLSLFLSKGERDDLVWRNTSSGARFTNRFKKGMQTENQSGDISYTHELSIPFFTKFNVECKAYQDIKLWSIIEQTSKSDDLFNFLKQTIRDAEASNKSPILIAKQNNKKVLIFIEKKYADYLKINYLLLVQIETYQFSVFQFEKFLELDPFHFETVYKL